MPSQLQVQGTDATRGLESIVVSGAHYAVCDQIP